MNTIISMANQIIELHEQGERDDILPHIGLMKAAIKAEKIKQEMMKLRAYLCASCEEIGTTETDDLTVNLECAKDE